MEDLQESLHEEANRVHKLKLSSELRDKELKIAQHNFDDIVKMMKTLIEGKFFKFGKNGKLSPKLKYIWFHVLDNGVSIIE